MVQPSHIRGPLGTCIYCGVAAGKLSKEHIVPEALGGIHIITRASCNQCREYTNHKIDKLAISGLMQARAAYGFTSKRPKNRQIETINPPERLTSFDFREYTQKSPVYDYKGMVTLPYLAGPPGLLLGSHTRSQVSMWVDTRYGGSILMDVPPVEGANAVAAMVGKIAYSAAIFDGQNCNPKLFKAVVDDPRMFVGRPLASATPPFKLPYHLSKRMHREYLIYYVRLFSAAPMPYDFEVALPFG